MGDGLITLNDIGKRYHSKTIIEHVNLSINKGESVVFVGHNGTGKSTLLKIISGLLRPSTGFVEMNPHNLLFHYIPEHFPQYNMTAKEYLMHMSRLDGLSKDQHDYALDLFHDFFMDSMIDIPMKHLSKGTLQKVGVVQALITKPDVMLLDEPLSGQDTDSQNVFIDKMNELRENHTTLIMSCHENYLIRRISDTIYQVKDKQVRHVLMKEKEDKSDYFCEFITSDYKKCVTDQIQKCTKITDITYRMDIEGRIVGIMITGSLKECNEIISLMMEDKWILKKMNSLVKQVE